MADPIDPRDPKLADALNPRLALAKRMAAEGQQPDPLLDVRPGGLSEAVVIDRGFTASAGAE